MIIKALQEVFSQRAYTLGWLILSILFLFVFLYIPVRAIPGNSFLFQLSILSPKEYILLGLLALFASLSLVMQWYLWKRKREAMSALVSSGAGGVAATVASMFGTATCASCISALFGFLGIGAVFTLIDWRNYIVVASSALLFTSVYFASRKINGICSNCESTR